ncbi:uncharacterized protein LOC114074741 [Solanum pennellii]|uniref:Uncharacterized protein LOC114074741 n=1 Tax=Solanum pennellii TaxID=28526 RepID=A0ABM1UYF9_SOLPN|nr:uncharacterized protein LOC114074741 [Solanum pennellii]
MINPIFIGSKTSENPQEFVDDVHKIFVAMEDTDTEKIDLVSYQLNDVAQTWFKMWQESQALSGVTKGLDELVPHRNQRRRGGRVSRSTTIRGGRPMPKKGNGEWSYGRECPHKLGQAGGNARPRPNPQGATTAEPPRRYMFYALKGREEQEKSVNVVIGILKVFSTSGYALHDPWCTLSYVNPLLALTFEILPYVLHDQIVVSTPLGEDLRMDRVYKEC